MMEALHTAENEIVLPSDVLAKDIFQRLRKASTEQPESIRGGESTTEMSLEFRDCTMAQENRRRHPSLQRSLSHETTLKRRKRHDVRQSLDERSLCAEWALYTPEERQILKFVILKADSEECRSDGKKGSKKKPGKLQKLRLNKPKIFCGGKNTTGDRKICAPIQPTSVSIYAEKDKHNNSKASSKMPNFIRRFMDCSSSRTPIGSPKMNQRRQNELDRKTSFGGRDTNEDRISGCRRPSGNSPVHAMIKKEIGNSSSDFCLSASNCSVVEEVEKARLEFSCKMDDRIPRRGSDIPNKSNVKQRVKLFRANSARAARPSKFHENEETFFEIFDKFCKDPMTLVDDAELDY